MIKIVGIVLQAEYPKGLSDVELGLLQGALFASPNVRMIVDRQLNYSPETFFLTWQGEAEAGIEHITEALQRFS